MICEFFVEVGKSVLVITYLRNDHIRIMGYLEKWKIFIDLFTNKMRSRYKLDPNPRPPGAPSKKSIVAP